MVERHYDTLKNWAQIYLPALGTLYFTLATIWHIPSAEEVVGSIVALDTFLGVILKISTSKYKPPTDGKVLIDQENGRMVMDFQAPVEEISDKRNLVFQVVPSDLGPSQGKQAL